MSTSAENTPDTLDTKSLNGNAFAKPDAKTVRMLKETGDIGVQIKFDPKTGFPVVWIWQTFTVIRLDVFQALTLAAKIMEVVYGHFRNPKQARQQDD